MTDPPPPTATADQPPWRQRLLDRIQNLAADQIRVFRLGYQSVDGDGESPALAWYTRLRELAGAREEIEAHAWGVGIAQAHIDDARISGHQGFHVDSDTEPGNAVREKIIDRIAADTWQLQHMVAIHAARTVQSSPSGAEIDSESTDPFERTMAAVWMRATAFSHAINLTAEEYAGMWASDEEAWLRVLSATLASYDHADREERHRIYSGPTLVDEAHRDLRALGLDPAAPLEHGPIPSPHDMYQHVSTLLEEIRDTPMEYTIENAVDIMLPAGIELPWITESPDLPNNSPPHTDPADGVEP